MGSPADVAVDLRCQWCGFVSTIYYVGPARHKRGKRASVPSACGDCDSISQSAMCVDVRHLDPEPVLEVYDPSRPRGQVSP